MNLKRKRSNGVYISERYIADIEFTAMQVEFKHRWYQHYIKALTIHGIGITMRMLDVIEDLSNKKVEINENR